MSLPRPWVDAGENVYQIKEGENVWGIYDFDEDLNPLIISFQKTFFFKYTDDLEVFSQKQGARTINCRKKFRETGPIFFFFIF
jgi:hypothetical protein